MLTHNQLIYVLRALCPQITEADHGSKYWVAMPVEGDRQVGAAQIVAWYFDDFSPPTDAEIDAKWAQVKDAYQLQELEAAMRAKRDQLLPEADKLVSRALDAGDADLTARCSWYRQALRDVPAQPGFPTAITWPELPI